MREEKDREIEVVKAGSKDKISILEWMNLSEEEELLLYKIRAEAACEAQKMGKIIRSVQNKDMNCGRGGEKRK